MPSVNCYCLNSSFKNICSCRDIHYVCKYVDAKLQADSGETTKHTFYNWLTKKTHWLSFIKIIIVCKNKALTWWVGWVECLCDAKMTVWSMLWTVVNPRRWELEKELNITTTRAFLSETAARGASLLWGCKSPLGARDPLSTELCCHTVVDLFNYILKMTPAERAVTEKPGGQEETELKQVLGFNVYCHLSLKQ